MIEPIEYMRVNSDVNGNARYVVHYSEFLSNKELKEIYDTFIANHNGSSLGVIQVEYDYAIAKSKSLVGGKRYRGKEYGGGIVFQSHNIKQDLETIAKSKED
jgi:hypothetical protein